MVWPWAAKPVDDLLEVLDRAHVGGQDEAVLTGDSAAVHHLGGPPGHVAHALQLPRSGRTRITALRREAERSRVKPSVVAEDHLIVLETLQSLGDRRRRQTDAAAQLGQAQPSVGLQLGEEAAVGPVEDSIFAISRLRL